MTTKDQFISELKALLAKWDAEIVADDHLNGKI